MRYFAIKHKPTGDFIPWNSRGRAQTHMDPVDPKVMPPRLFTHERDAASALKWWAEGEHYVNRTQDYFGEYDEDWKLVERPDRNAEDMEIVLINLIEVRRLID